MTNVIRFPRVVRTGPHSLLSIIATKDGGVTHTCISVAQPPRPKTENKVIALHRRKPVPG